MHAENALFFGMHERTFAGVGLVSGKGALSWDITWRRA